MTKVIPFFFIQYFDIYKMKYFKLLQSTDRFYKLAQSRESIKSPADLEKFLKNNNLHLSSKESEISTFLNDLKETLHNNYLEIKKIQGKIYPLTQKIIKLKRSEEKNKEQKIIALKEHIRTLANSVKKPLNNFKSIPKELVVGFRLSADGDGRVQLFGNIVDIVAALNSINYKGTENLKKYLTRALLAISSVTKKDPPVEKVFGYKMSLKLVTDEIQDLIDYFNSLEKRLERL